MSAGVSVTAALIARDESEVLGRILADVNGLVDQIVVVDTGSADDTANVAAVAGAEVYQYEWCDDFAAARNESFGYAQCDWIIWLDADDRIPSEAAAELRKLFHDLGKSEQVANAVMVPYRLGVESPAGRYSYVAYRERIVRRSARFRWHGRVHETLAIDENPLHCRSAWIEHHPRRAESERHEDYYGLLLEEAIAAGDRTPKVLFHYGRWLRQHQRWSEALSVFEEYTIVSEHDATRYQALVEMSRCTLRLGGRLRARDYLLEALALDSRRSEAFLELGDWFLATNQPRRARPFFRGALEAEEPDWGGWEAGSTTWRPLLGLAACAEALGDVETRDEMLCEARNLGAPPGESGSPLQDDADRACCLRSRSLDSAT